MIQIPAVIERCAGIDVGKREIAVAVITGPADQEGETPAMAERTGLHQCGYGEYRLLLDSREKHSGGQCEDRAGLCPQAEACARRQDRFSGRRKSGASAPARTPEGQFPDATAKETARQSFGGEESNPESAGNGECQHRQHRQRCFRRLRPGHGQRTDRGTPDRCHRDCGSE